MGKSVQKDKNTFKHSSSKGVEVAENTFREMLRGQELPARDVVQNGPKQDDAEPTIRNKTVDSKTEPPAPAAGTIPADSGTTPDRSGFQRKKILLPNFDAKTFLPIATVNRRVKSIKDKIGGEEVLNKTVPVWEKVTLTLDEAAEYSNIGINKIREISNNPRCNFVIFVGKKRLIKRKEFEKFISDNVEL